MEYDLIVAGAGTAGCMAAYTAAKRNFDVCLVEAKPKEIIGDKICGNAISNHHFERINFKPPREVITNKIEGLILYSPSLTFWKIPGGKYKGVMIDRKAFGQYLLGLAIEAGVELKDQTPVIKPLVEENFVEGLEVKNEKIRAKITIDACGLNSPIRKNLSKIFGIEEIKEKDINLAYREIRKVRKKVEDENYCRIYLNPDKFPGGYAWIFPQTEDLVNVGLGVQKIGDYPNPKERLYQTILKFDLFDDSEIISIDGRKQAGGMNVPTRRSLYSLVENGILFAGEAGCIIDPVTGGGNGQALVSGKLAAEVACNALEKGDVSKESLWEYNLKHYCEEEGYGLKYTPLDIFRIFIQSLSPKDLDYIANSEIIKKEDLLILTTKGELKLSKKEAVKRFFKGIGTLRLLKDFVYVREMMEKVKESCLNFPKFPSDFNEWKEKIEQSFSEVEKKFKPYSQQR
jgi:geranylgeranyl reductase family protein